MAPTPEDVINTLKGTVDKLEARVEELESRLRGKDAGSSAGGSSGSGMRMILIGPPGAGKYCLERYSLTCTRDHCKAIQISEMLIEPLVSQARVRKHPG